MELLPWLLGWRHAALPDEQRKEVEVALHAGTAVALVCIRGRAVLGRPWLTALATAPAAVVALALEDRIERRLGGPRAMAAGLLAGSLALMACRPRAGAAALLRGRAPRRARPRRSPRRPPCGPGVSRAGRRARPPARSASRRADAKALSGEVAIGVLAGAAALKGVRLAARRPPGATLAALAAGAATAAASTRAAAGLDRLATLPAAVWAGYRTVLAAAVLAASRSDRAVRHNGRR